MEREKSRGVSTRVKLGIALLAGLLTIALLLPWSGVDTDPPECFSMFDYTVPCGSGLAFAAGAAVVGLVGLVVSLMSRRR